MTQFTSWNMRVYGVPSRRIAIAVCVGLATTAVWFSLHPAAAKAAPAGSHGLTGFYYVSDLPLDEFQIPESGGKPAATRVDGQIAFGQGKGFHDPKPDRSAEWAKQPGFSGDRVGWLKAVIWRGFIHLPKAGTYYFATASDGASAIYLNQARVALNGMASHYGRLLTSETFAYDQTDVQDFIQNVKGTPFGTRRQDAYIVPVTVEAARDFPLEVRYSALRSESTTGIDLLWATPDSPKDATGKPIMKLVPADALYTEAPSTLEQPAVRSANSTISADLYCAGVKETKPLTLTFRLANKDGRPVAGKRVYFATLADEDFGFDQLVQADKPTDQNGITTAQLKSKPDARAHNSAIYATDVTDLVDIGQVAHVRFPEVQEGFFASPCTAGFDPNLITVEPQPMVVGRPLTLKVKLQNRQKSGVELDATFQATDWNIGANTWKDVGHVDHIRLKPGESKDVSVTWTPNAEQVHQCFRVVLSGRIQVAEAARGNVTIPVAAALLPSVVPVAALQTASAYKDLTNPGTVQRNVGPVGPPPPCGGPNAPVVEGGHTVELGTIPFTYKPCTPSADWKKFARDQWDHDNAAWQKRCKRYLASTIFGSDLTVIDVRIAEFASGCDFLGGEMDNAATMANDPPDPQYRAVVVAKSDSAGAYIDAWRRSWERYQGARATSDRVWMDKHATAIRQYAADLIASLQRSADAVANRASQLTAQDDIPPDQLKKMETAVNDWLRKGAPLDQKQREALRSKGISEEKLKKIFTALSVSPEKVPLVPLKAQLLEQAAAERGEAEVLKKLDTSPSAPELAGGANQPQVQVFNLTNPQANTEDVHLYIQPMSLPSSWQLSVVNAEKLGAQPQAAGDGQAPPPQPEFPIHEVQPGREYVVTLPSGKEIKVASVVVPRGELGANTTARWAVQGKIGNEVIGTMVHELNVPYVLADMKLPEVGSKEIMEDGLSPATTQPRQSYIVAIAAAVGAAVILILFFWLLRRRRHAPAA